MGWWPFSSSDNTSTLSGNQTENAPAPKRDFRLTDEQHLRIFGRPRQDYGSANAREEQADAELNAFLKEIGATPEPTAAASANTVAGSSSAAASDETTAAQQLPPTPTPPAAASTPTAPSTSPPTPSTHAPCGKFNDIYRHGHLNSCSEQWGAFWFCMRVRQYADFDKQEVIKEFYKERDEKRKQTFGNSEDVWEIRTKGVERAFWKDPNADGGGDVAVKE
ncbi:hypothetical protein Q7P36_009929 [Cladosporium allicinum]